MPITTKIKKQISFIHSKGAGTLTLGDLETHHCLFVNNPSIYGYNEILDLSSADLSALNHTEVLTVAETVSSSNAYDPKSKLAIILKTKQQEEVINLYQLARTFSDNPCRSMLTFYSHNDAMKWISN